MKKNVWIMNHYAGGMSFDRGGRHYNLAKYLRRNGYAPVVFCANSKHGPPERFYNTDALWHEHMAEEIGVPFVFVKARTYTGNGKQRVLNMLDFYRNVRKAAKEYAAKNGRPDVIYASSVHPLTLVAGIQLAKRFGVKCVCEVRDLWPAGIVSAYPGRFNNDSLLMKLLYRGERWIYKKADALIFTMEGGGEYIAQQGWDTAHGGPVDLAKVHHINNGVDLEVFDYNRDHFPVSDPDLSDPEVFKAVYTGSIRHVNNLGLLVDAAKEIKDPRVKLLIWGSGDELEALQKRVADEKLSNVVFKGRVEKQYVPSIVSQADLNVVHWEMFELLRFGVSYNKLFEYLAAGRPVFSTVRPGYSILDKYGCGMDTEGFEPADFARGVETFAAMPAAERRRMGENARQAAGDYDFRVLTKKLIEIMEQ